MAKKKLNKELLNEELKRFNMINEYAFNFYEDRAGDDVEPHELLLDKGLYEEEPEADAEVGEDVDLGFGDDAEAEDEAPEEAPEEDAEGEEDIDLGFGDEEGGEGLDDFSGPEAEEEAGDEVELDVTELVKGSEEAKASADAANEKIEQLMGMVAKLEGKLSSMDAIGQKIDNLEAEVERRVPTEDEKLELRSLDSAPFKMRLGDYWKDKEGKYDVMGQNNEPKEYELTQDDINDYSDVDIKKSFDNEYTEEDI